MTARALLPLLLLAACGKPAPPDVVLITVDTLRADHCSFYGYPRPTMPEIEKLAARAVVYEQADAAASFTQGSVGTILTGLYPSQHGATGHPSVLNASAETIAEALKLKGYLTSAVVTNPILKAKMGGKPSGFDQGFDTYTLENMQLDDSTGKPPANAAARTTDLALAALGRLLAEKKPFFLWVHYMDPHWWYTPPPPFDTKFSPALPEWSAFEAGTFDGTVPIQDVYFKNTLSAAGKQRGVDLYDGEIAYADQQIGRFLADLDKLKLTERTVVAFTADHGESLGEHAITFCHGYFTYEDNLHVPLLMAGPGIAPRHEKEPFSLVDLKELILRAVDPARAATLASKVLGESEPLYGPGAVRPNLPGRPRAYVVGDAGKWRSYREGSLKLIRVPGQPGSELELYDLAADPNEQHDLSATRPADRDRLAKELPSVAAATTP